MIAPPVRELQVDFARKNRWFTVLVCHTVAPALPSKSFILHLPWLKFQGEFRLHGSGFALEVYFLIFHLGIELGDWD